MRLGWILAAAVLAVAGCSGEDGSGAAGGSGGAAGAAGAGGTGGTGGGGEGGGGAGGSGGDGGTGGTIVIPSHETDVGWEPQVPSAIEDPSDPGYPLNEEARPASCGSEHGYFSVVRGWIAAPGGEPLAGAKAQLCVYSSAGQYACLSPATTDEEGVYTISVQNDFRCFDEAAIRLLQYDSYRATTYCPIDLSVESGVRLTAPGVLPFANPALDLPPLGDPEVAREVRFEDGLTMSVTPSLFVPDDSKTSYRNFAGRRVSTEAVGLCGDAPSFDGVFALYPEGQVEGPGFPLRFPNDDGWAPGTKVDLFVLGGVACYVGDARVPEAAWAKFGEGTVSDDGAFVVSDENAGLPCFTWLAYRAKE
ncbi:MAG TPA: hypothetical protein VN033_06175 [Vulgatibacter sp.]|nr:hypothetical protein [Vulgatibacter sp.]